MLLRRIDAFLKRTRTAPTRFGRDVVGDPNFIASLKQGRELRASTVRRVRDYLDAHEGDVHPMELRP